MSSWLAFKLSRRNTSLPCLGAGFSYFIFPSSFNISFISSGPSKYHVFEKYFETNLDSVLNKNVYSTESSEKVNFKITYLEVNLKTGGFLNWDFIKSKPWRIISSDFNSKFLLPPVQVPRITAKSQPGVGGERGLTNINIMLKIHVLRGFPRIFWGRGLSTPPICAYSPVVAM